MEGEWREGGGGAEGEWRERVLAALWYVSPSWASGREGRSEEEEGESKQSLKIQLELVSGWVVNNFSAEMNFCFVAGVI